MKRNFIWQITIVVLILLTGCQNGTRVPTLAPISTTPATSPTQAPASIPTPTAMPTLPTTPEPTPEDVVLSGTTYTNERCGYQLTFPASWDGCVRTGVGFDNEKDLIVYFNGKSETAKKLDEEYGIDMFMILSESTVEDAMFLDSVELLGETRGVSYYYATSTDFAIGGISDALRHADLAEAVIAEAEWRLATEDLDKAMSMVERANIEFVKASFKATDDINDRIK